MSMMNAIRGVIASRETIESEFFTSVLYPYFYEETMTVNVPGQVSGNLWYIPEEIATVSVPTLVTGDLIPTIVYKTYNEPLAAESATVSVPTLVTGDLVTTINYITYNDGAIENVSVAVPTLLSGTLS